METVFINESPGLKCFDAGVNPSLMRLDIVGGTPAYFKMDKTKSALKKLSVKKCKGLKVLYADWNSLTHIDLSGNKKLESLNLSGCKLRSLNLSNNKKITDLDVSYNKMEKIEDFSYYKEYDKSYNLNGYNIKLKYGMYSESTKSGKCIFEVEKENGVMEEPHFVYGNELVCFGDNICICLNGTGTICSKAELDNGKLLVYTEFSIDVYSQHEKGAEQRGYHIYFDCPSKAEECARGAYGVKLDDNIGGKEYKLDDGTILKISSMGIVIETNKELETYQIEISDKNNNKKTVYDKSEEEYEIISGGAGVVTTKKNEVFGKADIHGCYSQRCLGVWGNKERYFYAYRYKNIYNIDNIEHIYVNGKEILTTSIKDKEIIYNSQYTGIYKEQKIKVPVNNICGIQEFKVCHDLPGSMELYLYGVRTGNKERNRNILIKYDDNGNGKVSMLSEKDEVMYNSNSIGYCGYTYTIIEEKDSTTGYIISMYKQNGELVKRARLDLSSLCENEYQKVTAYHMVCMDKYRLYLQYNLTPKTINNRSCNDGVILVDLENSSFVIDSSFKYGVHVFDKKYLYVKAYNMDFYMAGRETGENYRLPFEQFLTVKERDVITYDYYDGKIMIILSNADVYIGDFVKGTIDRTGNLLKCKYYKKYQPIGVHMLNNSEFYLLYDSGLEHGWVQKNWIM